jgi:hypothetical protein
MRWWVLLVSLVLAVVGVGAAKQKSLIFSDSVNNTGSCSNAVTSKVLWNSSSKVFTCGTDQGGGSGAPTTVDYLVGTADAGLSAEIVFGAAVANQWVTGVTGGAVTRAQPTFTDISGSATDGQIPNNVTIDLAAAATALAANPADCGANQFATTIAASGALTCAALTDGDIPNGITVDVATLATIATTANSAGSATGFFSSGTLEGARGGVGTALPTCGGTDKLTANGTVVSCATDQTGGGGGGGNSVEVTLDFSTGAEIASVVVTGQAWVTAGSEIVCSPTMMATADRAEGAEDAVIEGLVVSAHSRSAGVGFTLTGAPRFGNAYGRFAVHCIGV